MKVLVACEFSGVVRDEFNKLGHDAWSCDLIPTESTRDTGKHLEGDVRIWISEEWQNSRVGCKWDLMIAHPPCTRLCNSGVRWLHERDLWDEMREAALFFKELLEAPIPKIAVENPIMHKYALEIIGRKHDQTIQPWMFGEDASKRTCLWLKNLPLLTPTKIIKKKRYANQTPSGQNKLGPSEDRAKLRSITYKGIAKAMAEQFGGVLSHT